MARGSWWWRRETALPASTAATVASAWTVSVRWVQLLIYFVPVSLPLSTVSTLEGSRCSITSVFWHTVEVTQGWNYEIFPNQMLYTACTAKSNCYVQWQQEFSCCVWVYGVSLLPGEGQSCQLALTHHNAGSFHLSCEWQQAGRTMANGKSPTADQPVASSQNWRSLSDGVNWVNLLNFSWTTMSWTTEKVLTDFFNVHNNYTCGIQGLPCSPGVNVFSHPCQAPSTQFLHITH